MSESASNGDRDPATEKIHNDNRTCAVQLDNLYNVNF